MNGWGLFSLAVIAVPLVALGTWMLSEHASGRRRRKFLRRHSSRSVAGIHERVDQETASEKTRPIPKIRRGTLTPDPLQNGTLSGRIPLPKTPRRYTRRQTPGAPPC